MLITDNLITMTKNYKNIGIVGMPPLEVIKELKFFTINFQSSISQIFNKF